MDNRSKGALKAWETRRRNARAGEEIDSETESEEAIFCRVFRLPDGRLEAEGTVYVTVKINGLFCHGELTVRVPVK